MLLTFKTHGLETSFYKLFRSKFSLKVSMESRAAKDHNVLQI